MDSGYVYEIQAFGYDGYEHHLLINEKEYSTEEFSEIIEQARQKAKKENEEDGNYTVYPYDVLEILKIEFGFEESYHMVGYIGSYYDDICEVEYK